MSGSIDRRLRRPERGAAPPRVVLPWGRPAAEWTDAELLAVLGLDASVSDDDRLPRETREEWIARRAAGMQSG